MPTLVSLVVVGVAALVFYAWAVRRERKLRELVPSAETPVESDRIADRSKLRPAFHPKRAPADEVDVLTGGVTL